MFFSIALGPITRGKGNYNASSRRMYRDPAATDGSKLSETSFKQTPQEHQALLDSFKNEPGINPAVAIELGEQAEKACPRYWDGDESPRHGGTTPSSSFIQGISVSPNLGLATVITKNGKSYSYKLTADQVADAINSNSIGSWYNKFIKGAKVKEPVVSSPRSGNPSGTMTVQIKNVPGAGLGALPMGASSSSPIPTANPYGFLGGLLSGAISNALQSDREKINKAFGSGRR